MKTVQPSSDPHLGMEPDAACLRTATGEPLFDGDKPTKVLNDAISLTAALRNNLLASEQFASSLDKAGLLEEEQAKIDFAGGGNAVVRGFQTRQTRSTGASNRRDISGLAPLQLAPSNLRSYAFGRALGSADGRSR